MEGCEGRIRGPFTTTFTKSNPLVYTNRDFWVIYFAPRDRKRTATQAATATSSGESSPRRKPWTSAKPTLSPSRHASTKPRKPVLPIDFIHEPYMSLPPSKLPLEAIQGPSFNSFAADVFFDLSLNRNERAHLLQDTYNAFSSALPPFAFNPGKPIPLSSIDKILLRDDFKCRQPPSDGAKYVNGCSHCCLIVFANKTTHHAQRKIAHTHTNTPLGASGSSFSTSAWPTPRRSCRLSRNGLKSRVSSRTTCPFSSSMRK